VVLRDVTGLETADGKVTLARWLNDGRRRGPKELAPPIPLTELFARLQGSSVMSTSVWFFLSVTSAVPRAPS
jgi:hypothetical protein